MQGPILGNGFLGGGAAIPSLKMTITATANIDPVIVAAALADGDCVWTDPLGGTFTGKSPDGANFVTGGVGEYSVVLTDWTKLDTFSCDNDTVSALEIPAEATAFRVLNAGNNAISTLDLSAFTAMTSVNIYDNALSSIDVSNMTSLIALRYYTNAIKSVVFPVTANTLRIIDGSDNALTDVQVDAVIAAVVACGSDPVAAATLTLTGDNAARTAASDADKATLEGRNWTVVTT